MRSNRERAPAIYIALGNTSAQSRDNCAKASRTLKAQMQHPRVCRSYLVPVLVKTFEIVRLLESSDRPLKVSEISKQLKYPMSTVYRILRTLSAYGYLPHGSAGVYTLKAVRS